ncbi:MAG: dipicolinate synthase subunit B [Bacillota bacterium]|nr:dipicolinate synthase subunit B [Bacillota bacterium]HOB91043.1 dipicolinate synthase subunit B [Bacillota bacterium]HPZ54169.1 dipicolinate synthase subunit B [Bacillota bacterium]HQD18091.1 dipicolinate synthase subunit B [Bacillota bacterium]
MRFKGRKIGFALTGSHCTIPEVLPVIESLVKDGAGVLAIVSESVRDTDTRFGTAEELMRSLARITGAQPISTVAEAEPLGPKRLLDCLVIAPCTGNTAARLANGIVDGPVTMAAKAQLRNKRPVVIAISTNDGLGLNAKNIGVLLNTPDIYMVPYRQDNPAEKPKSIVALMHRIPDTIESAINGKQIQPIIVGPC